MDASCALEGTDLTAPKTPQLTTVAFDTHRHASTNEVSQPTSHIRCCACTVVPASCISPLCQRQHFLRRRQAGELPTLDTKYHRIRPSRIALRVLALAHASPKMSDREVNHTDSLESHDSNTPKKPEKKSRRPPSELTRDKHAAHARPNLARD